MIISCKNSPLDETYILLCLIAFILNDIKCANLKYVKSYDYFLMFFFCTLYFYLSFSKSPPLNLKLWLDVIVSYALALVSFKQIYLNFELLMDKYDNCIFFTNFLYKKDDVVWTAL